MFPEHLVKKAAARQSYEQLREVANRGPGVRPDVKMAPTTKKLADKLIAKAFPQK